METVDTDVFWSRVVAAPAEFESLVTADAAWNACAAVVWRVVGGSLVLNGPPMLVAAWEENLGLEPAEGDGVPARKAAVLQRLCDMGLPVTVACLEAELARMLGEGRARVKHSGDTLTLALALDTTEEQIAEVQKVLDRVLPNNLVTEMEWADGLPIDYTHVEYLESTGTQYIKLGDYDVVPDTGFEVEFLKHKAQTNGFCGSGNRMSLWHYGHGQVAARYGGGDATLAYMPNDTRIVCKKIDARNWLDGVEKASNTGSNSDVKTYSMWLFATDVYYRSATVIYSAIFWQGAAVLHDVIPALDPTGTPCMFDLISKTPYYNNGTGDFLYPGKEEEATTYSLRRPLTYAQATAHGIRRLYHVPRGYNGTREEYAAEHGYKVLVETPEPEEGYWSPVWHETEEEIVLEWVETEPPAEGEGLISDSNE